jgi:hypothetical protein
VVNIQKGGHMKERKLKEEQMDYEEPLLLGAEDLMDVAGGCLFSCSDGDCKPKTA